MPTIARDDRIHPRDRARLVACAEKVAELTDQDFDPTEAVVLVAKQAGLNSHFIRLLAHAHNIGAQNAQHQLKEGQEKYADFPLANAEAAIHQVYATAKTATAAVDQGAPSPVLRRLAYTPEVLAERTVREYGLPTSAPPVDLEKRSAIEQLQWRQDARLQATRHLEQIRSKLGEAKIRWELATAPLVHYFRLDPLHRISLEQAEAALGDFSKEAGWLFTLLADRQLVKEARAAADQLPDLRGVDLQQSPFPQLRRCLDLLKQATWEALRLAQAEQLAAPLLQTWDAVPAAAPPEAPPDIPGGAGLLEPIALTGAPAKEAGLLGGVAGGLGWSLGEVARKGQAQEDKTLSGLEDPRYAVEHQQARVQANLQDMLNNDPVISGYDPDEVLGAYNEISALNPRLAMQPAIVRSMLRHTLSQGRGNIGSFELQQLADIGQKITPDMPAPPAPPVRK